MKTEDLEIGDEVWFMKDNKPVCYYVWEIHTIDKQVHDSEYGQAYNQKIIQKKKYLLMSDKYNNYGASALWLEDLMNKQNVFPTKKELIESL